MIKTNRLFESVKTEIRKISENEIQGFTIFLFGSILNSNTPNDIDMLITYENTVIDIEKALSFRKKMINHIQSIYNLPTDICLLSKQENQSSNFSVEEKAQLIR